MFCESQIMKSICTSAITGANEKLQNCGHNFSMLFCLAVATREQTNIYYKILYL
jgi:hypothetical protein